MVFIIWYTIYFSTKELLPTLSMASHLFLFQRLMTKWKIHVAYIFSHNVNIEALILSITLINKLFHTQMGHEVKLGVYAFHTSLFQASWMQFYSFELMYTTYFGFSCIHDGNSMRLEEMHKKSSKNSYSIPLSSQFHHWPNFCNTS